jgi:hypothetical protein
MAENPKLRKAFRVGFGVFWVAFVAVCVVAVVLFWRHNCAG